ncbi:MAG: site-2 protease family protein [Phycisphaerales bacterium JB050]
MYSDHSGNRDDFRERGRWGQFFARVLENPDNPLGWSVRLFVFKKIDVRIHLLTVIFMIGVVLASIPSVGDRGWLHLITLTFSMLALFLIVLLHEFGHCFGARLSGGSANRIVMLPIGGLALAMPRHHWKSHLITAVAGPAVNVAILPLTTVALWALGQQQVIVFNPLHPTETLATITTSSNLATVAMHSLWWLHYINFLILAFNLLLVFFPFDGGRIVQAIMWRKMGYLKSMTAAVYIGLVGAGLVCVIAIVLGQSMIVAIAAFGLIACWMERMRLKAADEITGYIPDDMAGLGAVSVVGGATDEDDDRESKAEQRRREREEKEQAELDRVLEKISVSGMDSLTASEKRLLSKQTKKRQQG